ncbi:MAG: LemA family protein [Chlamydiales bacterium]|nr:LemA family protein [Chlamydiales bacterium]
MGTLAIIILGVVLIMGLWLMSVYNTLVRYKNQVKNAWGQIDVQLQRRHDLIPNLVEAVKGYMAHERGTLESVTNARNQAEAARTRIQAAGGPTDGSIKDLVVAESALQGGMTKLFAVAENYPELRASENMQQLQEELSSTENKVAFARQSYNDMVLAYNNAQQVFPAMIVAPMFGHHEVEQYQVEEPDARKAVKVSFS